MLTSLNYLAKRSCGRMNGQLAKHAFDFTKPSIKLNQVEQKICRVLNDYTSLYNKNHGELAEPLTLRISGGWVRDKLLGRESHDLDIAINIMSGEQFAIQLNEFLNEHYDKYELEPHSIHKIDINPEKSKHLETATTKLYNIEIDFVNLRSEEYSEQSRIPVVKFGTAEQDALRRDATLNALFYNITQNKIEDFTKLGLRDLHEGILRTPLAPRKTFLDDPLRVLRLIRFAARYSFKIEPEVYEEMKHAEINNAFFNKISNERIGVEVEKILDGPNPLVGISLIQSTNIDNVVFRWHDDEEIIEFNEKNCENFHAIEKIYKESKLNQHLARIVENFDDYFLDNSFYQCQTKESNDFKKVVLLSCCLIPMRGFKIFWTTKKKMSNTISLVESILKNGLKIGKHESNQIAKVVDSLESYDEMVSTVTESLNDNLKIKRSDLGVFLRGLRGDWEIIHFVSLFNHYLYSAENYGQIKKRYEAFHEYIYLQKLENCHDLRPLINGKEMLKELNMKAGPWLGKINEKAILWQLDNPGMAREDLLNYIKTILPENS